MKTPVLIAIVILGSACAIPTSVTSGVPAVVGTDKDIVWVTRNVSGTDVRGTHYSYDGLFACYRRPVEKAGPPVCYLAQYLTSSGPVSWQDMGFPPRVEGAQPGQQ